jgi:hypothetical protein
MKIRRQQGMSIIGFIIVLGLVVFAAFITMRIVPIYLEYYSVVSAMNGIAAERGSSKYPLQTVRTKMMDRMFVNYTEGNLQRRHISIVRRDGVQFRVAYEVRKPLIGNLDVVASFDRMVKLAN